ncbi:hypothetical protein Bbelb_163940 [Branchiostoma belcheri]|nr:hypothetical protein Bbelb_163940 [Branchiostoma belcheri]
MPTTGGDLAEEVLRWRDGIKGSLKAAVSVGEIAIRFGYTANLHPPHAWRLQWEEGAVCGRRSGQFGATMSSSLEWVYISNWKSQWNWKRWIEPLIEDREVLCVVVNRTSSTCIFRFPGDKVLFCLGPLHPIRRIAICVATNKYPFCSLYCVCERMIVAGRQSQCRSEEKCQCERTPRYFEMFVMCTILINSLILSLSRPIPITDYVFMAIYTAEMAIRVVASGFIRRKHSYLRDMWNVIDFLVIFLA